MLEQSEYVNKKRNKKELFAIKITQSHNNIHEQVKIRSGIEARVLGALAIT